MCHKAQCDVPLIQEPKGNISLQSWLSNLTHEEGATRPQSLSPHFECVAQAGLEYTLAVHNGKTFREERQKRVKIQPKLDPVPLRSACLLVLCRWLDMPFHVHASGDTVAQELNARLVYEAHDLARHHTRA